MDYCIGDRPIVDILYDREAMQAICESNRTEFFIGEIMGNPFELLAIAFVLSVFITLVVVPLLVWHICHWVLIVQYLFGYDPDKYTWSSRRS